MKLASSVFAVTTAIALFLLIPERSRDPAALISVFIYASWVVLAARMYRWPASQGTNAGILASYGLISLATFAGIGGSLVALAIIVLGNKSYGAAFHVLSSGVAITGLIIAARAKSTTDKISVAQSRVSKHHLWSACLDEALSHDGLTSSRRALLGQVADAIRYSSRDIDKMSHADSEIESLISTATDTSCDDAKVSKATMRLLELMKVREISKRRPYSQPQSH